MNNKKTFLRIFKFGLVGASGAAVNQGILILCTRYFYVDYRIASLLAIETAIINNFLLNYHWTWQDRKSKKIISFIKFNLTSFITAFFLNWTTLVFLTQVLNIRYWISNLVGILFAAAANFLISNLFVFRGDA